MGIMNCATDEIMKYTVGGVWGCAADAGGAETNTLTTILTDITDDQFVIGGAGVATYDDVPDCDSAGSALTYDTTANNIDCATGFALLAGPTFSGIVTLPFALDPTTDANAEVSFDSDG